jgi:ribonuclease BN (tRNA processing enzyme)
VRASRCASPPTPNNSKNGQLDDALLELASGVDLLICDAQYTVDEYEGRMGPCRRGWGHSTYVAATQMARAAGVGQLILFHHDPEHDDAMVEAIERHARALFPATRAARETEPIDLGRAGKPSEALAG